MAPLTAPLAVDGVATALASSKTSLEAQLVAATDEASDTTTSIPVAPKKIGIATVKKTFVPALPPDSAGNLNCPINSTQVALSKLKTNCMFTCPLRL